MRKVLVVDDEKYIRKGVRAILEKADTEFKSVSEATNGKLAVEMIGKEHYDLVITDIRMPILDGIGLLAEVFKLEKKPKFIILSGYDDFSYAREAIRYGVREYLLKPVEREQLLEVIKKVESELRREEKVERDHEQLDVLVNNFKDHELNYLLQNSGQIEGEAEQIAEAINAGLLFGDYILSLMVRKSGVEGKSWNMDLQTRAVAEKYLKQSDITYLCFQTSREELAVITAGEYEASDLLAYLFDHTGFEYSIGLSSVSGHPRDLAQAYGQAAEALRYRVLKPSGTAIRYSDICNLNSSYKIPQDIIKKIVLVTDSNRREELAALLRQLFIEKDIYHNKIDYLLELTETLNKQLLEYYGEIIPQKAGELARQYSHLSSLYNFPYYLEYVRLLKDFIFEINSFMIALKSTYQQNFEIDEAIAYIRSNYHRELSMTQVANHVSVNYTYFSFLFSQRTGKSFPDYLREIRIEKAAELLNNSNYKANEIAVKTGFKNPKHFSRVFREVMGVSPSEYKKNIKPESEIQ